MTNGSDNDNSLYEVASHESTSTHIGILAQFRRLALSASFGHLSRPQPLKTFGARPCSASPAAGRTWRVPALWIFQVRQRCLQLKMCRMVPFVTLNQLPELRELFGSQLARGERLLYVSDRVIEIKAGFMSGPTPSPNLFCSL